MVTGQVEKSRYRAGNSEPREVQPKMKPELVPGPLQMGPRCDVGDLENEEE